VTPVFAKVDVMFRAKEFVSDLLVLGKISKEGKGIDSSPDAKKLVAKLSEGVDYESIANVSLGSKWETLKPAIKDDFMATLRETIETVLYPRAHQITTPLNEIKFLKNELKPLNVIAKTQFEKEKEGEIIERSLEFELVFAPTGKK
jgi:hypothetical protein